MKIPVKLLKPPLIEALFELRFEPSQDAAGELLPGLLFRSFSDFPDLKLKPLPVANIPRDIRDKDSNLRFRTSHVLLSSTKYIQTGDRAVVFSQTVPYEGWQDFKTNVARLLNATRETGLINAPLRVSMRCINIITSPEEPAVRKLNAHLAIAERDIENSFHLRHELKNGPCTNIIHLASEAQVELTTGLKRTGLLLDIDTVHDIEASFWENQDKTIETVHTSAKEMFFRLLKDDYLSTLEPQWEE